MGEISYRDLLTSHKDLWAGWQTSNGCRVVDTHRVPIMALTVGSLNHRPVAASGDSSGKILIHELRDGRQIGREILTDGGAAVRALAWVHQGDFLALVSLGQDSILRTWDPVTSRAIGKPLVHEGATKATHCQGRNGPLVVTGSEDGTLRAWEIQSGKLQSESLVRIRRNAKGAPHSSDWIRS
jgi:WD40 repeat protein